MGIKFVHSTDGLFATTFQCIIAFIKYPLSGIVPSTLEALVNNAFMERFVLYIRHISIP